PGRERRRAGPPSRRPDSPYPRAYPACRGREVLHPQPGSVARPLPPYPLPLVGDDPHGGYGSNCGDVEPTQLNAGTKFWFHVYKIFAHDAPWEVSAHHGQVSGSPCRSRLRYRRLRSAHELLGVGVVVLVAERRAELGGRQRTL